jgi:peptidase M24-like protein
VADVPNSFPDGRQYHTLENITWCPLDRKLIDRCALVPQPLSDNVDSFANDFLCVKPISLCALNFCVAMPIRATCLQYPRSDSTSGWLHCHRAHSECVPHVKDTIQYLYGVHCSALLSVAEEEWVDNYHKDTLSKLGPHVDAFTLAWMERMCRPLAEGL